MQRLHESLDQEGIKVVAISIDRGNLKKVKKYADQYHLSFTILLDPDQETRKSYFIRGLPVSYLIDAEGMLRGFISGARNWDHPSYKEFLNSLK